MRAPRAGDGVVPSSFVGSKCGEGWEYAKIGVVGGIEDGQLKRRGASRRVVEIYVVPRILSKTNQFCREEARELFDMGKKDGGIE